MRQGVAKHEIKGASVMDVGHVAQKILAKYSHEQNFRVVSHSLTVFQEYIALLLVVYESKPEDEHERNRGI